MRKSNKKAQLEPPMLVPAEQATDVFPAVRYFQIHFEFLQEQLQLILRNQEALQQQMQQLESRLARSGQGIRLDCKALNPLERLSTHRKAAQNSEASGLNSTPTGKR
jgi:hypothetical protein